MKGIIKGKKAYIYDKQVNTSKRTNQYNSFLKRNVVGDNLVIADFGCGTGISFPSIINKCKILYGIDGSKEMINICKEKYNSSKCTKKIKLILSDLSNTRIKKESCDLVIIRMTLHHLRNKKHVINEAHRILKSQGKLLVIDTFRHRNILITYLLDIKRNYEMGMELFQHNYCTLNEFTSIIKNKFKIININSQIKNFYTKANIILIKM
ncbi:MAG: class I SAM-dependent methyltransferase [Candidatus Woesearchaeota archaeon]